MDETRPISSHFILKIAVKFVEWPQQTTCLYKGKSIAHFNLVNVAYLDP